MFLKKLRKNQSGKSLYMKQQKQLQVSFEIKYKLKYLPTLTTLTTLTPCQRFQRLCGHTFFANIFAKTNNFAKPLLTVHMGSRYVEFFYFKKCRKSLDTVPFSGMSTPRTMQRRQRRWALSSLLLPPLSKMTDKSCTPS